MLSESLKGDFPLLSRVNYLNTASIGIVPRPVIEKVRGLSLELCSGGTCALDEEKETMIYEGLRKEGAKLLGCDVDEVAIFNSVTEAMNAIAWSLDFSGGNVVSTEVEFPSVTYPWMRLSKERRFEVRLVRGRNWYVSLDDLLSSIDENTKVVAISHVEYLTGQLHNLREISSQAHDVGAIVVVDGIQAAGYVPVDVRRLGVDVYITGSYKWLIAPFGATVAFISRELYERLEPAIVGWRSTERPFDFDARRIEYAGSARKFEYSTSAYDVKVGLAESIRYLRRIGIERIYEHDMKLVDVFFEELQNVNGVEIITPSDRREHGSIVTLRVDGRKMDAVVRRLRSADRPVEFSIRQGMLRFSPHLYNSEDDVIQAVDLIKEVMRE
ncbi:MAG: aminotransferase class V-fold PLP-dependent enzyme [Candidatus Baldrarchaeia archaeon]